MVIIATQRLKVETIWPELVNKRIQQLDLELKEIQFINQNQSLLAKGLILRKIRFFGINGYCRKTEDRIQFSVTIATPSILNLEQLKAEVTSEYYLFQPRHLGENSAILEQGFQLTIYQNCSSLQAHNYQTLLLNQLLQEGDGSLTRSFLLEFPKPILKPREFRGIVNFLIEPANLPLINAEITGEFTFLTTDQAVKEMPFQAKVDFLLNDLTVAPDQTLMIEGKLADFNWRQSLEQNRQSWSLELKLDYHYRIIQPMEVTCLAKPISDSDHTYQINNSRLVGNDSLAFSKCYQLPIGSWEITESRLKIIRHTEKLTAKGLLVSGILNLSLFFINQNGQEEYQSLELNFCELVAQPNFIVEPTSKVIADLSVKVAKLIPDWQQISLTIGFAYQLRYYQNQMVTLIESAGSETEIVVANFLGETSVNLMGEKILLLGAKPLEIKQVNAEIITAKAMVRQGWWNLSGEINLVVTYIDQGHQLHDDYYRFGFHESFSDEKISSSNQLDLTNYLSYDTFRIDEQRLRYQFLITTQVKQFEERKIKVTIWKEVSQPDKVIEKKHIPKLHLISKPRVLLEGELPLKFGRLQEMVESQVKVVEINCEQYQQVILLTGIISGMVKYWDREGYLRSELLKFSFWKLLPKGLINFEQLAPRIYRSNCLPREPNFWENGRIKIIVEFELI